MTHKGRVFLPKECCLLVTQQSLATLSLRKASAASVAAPGWDTAPKGVPLPQECQQSTLHPWA